MTERSQDPESVRVHVEEQFAKKELGLLLHRLRNLPTDSRARLQSAFAQAIIDERLAIETPNGPMSFVLLGRTTGGRALTVLTKQPGTIEWIDRFRPNSVFWDVGANVGVYTLYAALRRDTRVVAFEPAAINYFLLDANVEANRLDSHVDCLLVGLSNERTIGHLEVSQFDPAKSFSFRGKVARPYQARQAALMMSMDQLIEEHGLPCPNYIKIDVPGLTESIVAGGERLFRRDDLREVHIECSEEGKGGQRLVETLTRAGFVIAARHNHGGTTDLTFARPGA
jgi:FkbM family methyltransferase